MNNYVVARNALIATALVILFIVSIQPRYISDTLVNMSNMVSNIFTTQEIVAANNEQKQEVLKLSSYDEDNYVYKTEEYDGDIKDKILTLADELKKHYGRVTIHPILKGEVLVYEITSTEGVLHYVVTKVNQKKILIISPKHSSPLP